jgi:20S proteasome subunit alpha 5
VALLVAGVDEKGPVLYHTDPSGTFTRYEAKAIGAGSEGAQTYMQEHYNKVPPSPMPPPMPRLLLSPIS